MKNIIIILTGVLFTAIMSCNDDYLEKFPKDVVSDAVYWKTSTDIKLYANQFYPGLKPKHYNWRIDDNSDNNVPASRNSYVWGESIVPASGGGWGKNDWLNIRRVNYGLVRMADLERKGEVLTYEAELRFFRAVFYVDKIKVFGDVPWLETDLQVDSDELTKGRDSRKVVFANILKDLDFAIANLPETSKEDRLTKYAALAFKTEACLYEGTFRKYHGLGDEQELLRQSVNAAEQVINSGKFSIYSTGNPEKDYFDLFVQYELAGNPEGIMVQRFLTGKRMHNDVRALGEQHTGYSKDFVNSYLCKDGLPISLSPLYKGDQKFGDEFLDRDPRMEQSIYLPNRPYRIYSDGNVDYRTMPEFDNNYVTTSYYITKGYSPYEIDRLQNQTIIDNFIYRYGKLLVSYAEAKAELGELTQADLDNSINLLRDRIGMAHLSLNVGFIDPNWPDWEVPVSPIINEIRRERRIETAGEGTRWDDIVRWKAGKLLENPLTYKGARDPKTGAYRIVYPGGFERIWSDKLYLQPIPTQEMTLNPSLSQNPGW